MARVLLLMTTRTYRAWAFLEAARRLGVDVVVGSEQHRSPASRSRHTTLTLDFGRPTQVVRRILAFAEDHPLDAVVGVDDDTTILAALAAAALGLPHNSVESVLATRDKYRMRRLLASAGLPSPRFKRLSTAVDPAVVARRAPYPCVLKPVALSGSRGVIRANAPDEFVDAFRRIVAMLEADGTGHRHLLLETFLPGPEVALEGLLTGGKLRVLALFDKPDPLDGPYFEETLYVTPSRLPTTVQEAVAAATSRAAEALGLREGPLHAELRLGEGGPYIIEVAARSIGGLCSSILRFGTNVTLEELIVHHALGAEDRTLEREWRAAGVMMLPIPHAGIFRAFCGREEALCVPGIEEVAITMPLGQCVVPLPEGDRYLGFIFARGETSADVEAALREAHRHLELVIMPAN